MKTKPSLRFLIKAKNDQVKSLESTILWQSNKIDKLNDAYIEKDQELNKMRILNYTLKLEKESAENNLQRMAKIQENILENFVKFKNGTNYNDI